MIVLAVVIAGCGRKEGAGKDITAIETSDKLPENVKMLVRAVAANDSDSLVSMIDYPLMRPYPLRDIADAGQMKAYYRTLVDDSLQRVITESTPEQWDRYGWRGWTVRDGEYLWLDSLVYNVEYISQREAVMLASMRKQEIESLNPSLRGSWQPVTSFRMKDGSIARIDVDTTRRRGDDASVRLAIFSKGADLHANPAKVITGTVDMEGSAGELWYVFADKDGSTWSYSPNPTGEDAPAIYIEDQNGHTKQIEVKSVYWLDLVK